MSEEIAPDVRIDQRGAGCPGPLMSLVGKIKSADSGTTFELLTSDEGSKDDVPDWLDKAGHELLGIEAHEDEGYWSIYVRKS
jgi:TusA-related sulfurtransferase